MWLRFPMNRLGADVYVSIEHLQRRPTGGRAVFGACLQAICAASWLIGCIAVISGPTWSSGQQPDEPAAAVRDTGLETHYLKDESGHLVPVPNLSYEEFLRLYELDRGLRDPDVPPRYSLERMSLEVDSAGDQAQITAVFEIRLLADGMCAVPLRMSEAILAQPARHEGDGTHVLQSAGAAGGFVSWIRGRAEQTHIVRLDLATSVSRVGPESRLDLSLPRATSSSLRLVVPDSRAMATFHAPARLVGRRGLGDERIEFEAIGVSGDTQIAWGNSQPPDSARPLLMEATGVIQVRVKGPGAVTSEARIRLTSFGRRMDSVKIRLPQGSKPIEVEDPKYKLEFVDAANGSGGDAPIVVVKFTEPTEGPIEVQLAAEQIRPSVRPDTPMDVLGFEVIDALRHSGVVSITTVGDWQVRWDDDDINLSRLGVLPPGLAAENTVAAFEYYQQPSTLPIRIQRRQTRVSVEPTFVFDVGVNSVKLEAMFDVRVRGSAASFLRMDMEGWEVTGVSDSALGSDLALPATDVTPLEIALDPPRRGDFRLRVTAERALDPDTETLQLGLPSIRSTTTLPSVVVVSPADNVILSSLPDTSPSFDAEPIPESLEIPARERTPLAYRYRGDPRQAVLRYDFALRPRSISLKSEHRVELTTDQASVEQRLLFDVRYQPLDRLRIEVPATLAQRPDLQLLIDNERLDLSRVSRSTIPLEQDTDAEVTDASLGDAQQPAVRASTELWDIPLTLQKEGVVTVVARFLRPFRVAEEAEMLEIPTLRSADASTSESLLSLQSAEGIRLTVTEPVNWISDLRNLGADEAATYRTGSLPDVIQLTAQKTATKQQAHMIVERSFLQSWFAKSRRQDRAVFRLTNVGETVRFQLPETADERNTHVLFDGRPAVAEAQPDGWHTIYHITPPGTTHVLELSYAFADPRNRRIELPQIGGASYSQQFFWQLVLPQSEHLVQLPSELSSEDRWQRRGLFWRRESGKSDRWLAEFSGGSTQPVPPASCNTYLASGFGPLETFSAKSVSRGLLLFFSSGVVLFMGLLWKGINWQFVRWIAFLAVTGFVSAFWLSPDLATLVFQSAAFGGLLVLVMWCLDRWGRRRERLHSELPQSLSVATLAAARAPDSSHAVPSSTETAMQVPASANR